MEEVTKNLVNQQTFRSYLFFWSGQLFSILGSSITQFIIIWWLTETTGSPTILSIASFLYVLPLTIIFLIAGVITDKFDRKRIIIIVDSLQAFVTFIIIILFNLELITPLLIIIMNGFLGTFQGFHIPTVSAIVPTMVPKNKLSRMNGVNYLFTGFIQIIGPIIAATLFAFFPIKLILWIDPMTFLIALTPLLMIKIPKIEKTSILEKESSFIEDLKIGFHTLTLIPTVFLMLLISMFINFLARPLWLLLPYVIKFVHYGTPSDLALMVAFMNGGALLGAFISSIKKTWRHGIFIYYCGELILMLMIGVIALTPIGNFLWMSIAMVLYGISVPIINTIYLTIMQLKVPADKMGRISSIDYAISMAISPIATILAGPLAEIIGVLNLLFSCSIIGIIITFIFWWIAHKRSLYNQKKDLEKGDLQLNIESIDK